MPGVGPDCREMLRFEPAPCVVLPFLIYRDDGGLENALHVGGGAFGRSLRYDLRVLASNPLLTPDAMLAASPLIPAVTRRGDRVLVVLPGPQQAESLAFVDRGGLLALGDPTTNAVVGRLRGRLRDAVDGLPDRARILTREDWLAEAVAGRGPATGDENGARQALRLLHERFEPRVIQRGSGLVVAELRRRQPPGARSSTPVVD